MQSIWPFIRSLVIPTGATTGARIEINTHQNGQIDVFNSAGTLVDQIGGAQGQIVIMDGNSRAVIVQEGIIYLCGYKTGLPDQLDAGQIAYSVVSGNTFLSVVSPNDVANNFLDQASMLIQAGKPNLGVGGTGLGDPNVIFIDQAGTSAMWGNISGAWAKCTNTGTPYTWQIPTLASPFAQGGFAGTNYNQVQYRFMAEDNLRVVGTCHNTGTVAASQLLFTLPAAYHPKGTWRSSISRQVSGAASPENSGSTGVLIDSSGNVTLQLDGGSSSTMNFYIDIDIPLGNMS